MASFLACGATAFIAVPAFAGGKKAEAKCDKDGKPCKKGDDCKTDNCKPKSVK
jgi:hypothetical protein